MSTTNMGSFVVGHRSALVSKSIRGQLPLQAQHLQASWVCLALAVLNQTPAKPQHT